MGTVVHAELVVDGDDVIARSALTHTKLLGRVTSALAVSDEPEDSDFSWGEERAGAGWSQSVSAGPLPCGP